MKINDVSPQYNKNLFVQTHCSESAEQKNKEKMLNKTTEKRKMTFKILLGEHQPFFPMFYYEIFKHRAKLTELYNEHLYSHYLDSLINILLNFTEFALSHTNPLLSLFSSFIRFLLLLFYVGVFFVCMYFKANYGYYYTSP